MPARLNAADYPSRNQALPVPAPALAWLARLAAASCPSCEDICSLDLWVVAPQQSRETARWARLFLRLCYPCSKDCWPRSGRTFDATLGYPGEGPRPQALPLSRGPLSALPPTELSPLWPCNVAGCFWLLSSAGS